MQRTKWALGLVMMALGLMLTTQFRATRMTPTDPNQQRSDDLAQQLQAAQKRAVDAEAERDRLATEVDKLTKGTAAAGGTAPAVDMTPVEILAGTLPVQGPGLIITVVEDPAQADKTRVQDEDLWSVLNELLAAGAEGVSVNGQRITAITGIRNVGQRILIYQTMTSSPYEVDAIGDPTVLEAALRLRGGVIDTLGRFGIKVTIRRSDIVKLPAVGVPLFRYAKPVK